MGGKYHYRSYFFEKGLKDGSVGKAKYLFSEWDRIKKSIEQDFIYLFLDYDGTLAPIVRDPAKAFMPKRTGRVLSGLCRMPGIKIAVVSGRALGEVARFVGLREITYVGNHGFEIRSPAFRFDKPVPGGYKKALERIKNEINKRFSGIEGVGIDDKKISLSIHYRCAAKKDVLRIKSALRDMLNEPVLKGMVRKRNAKMAVEVVPPMDWNKGKAVLWLLARERSRETTKRRKVVPVYIGDDATDEDAFRAIGRKGITVLVGKNKKTASRYFLKNTNEVIEFMRRIKHG